MIPTLEADIKRYREHAAMLRSLGTPNALDLARYLEERADDKAFELRILRRQGWISKMEQDLAA